MLNSQCACDVAVLVKGNFISIPNKFSEFTFGNWEFQAFSGSLYFELIFWHIRPELLFEWTSEDGTAHIGAQKNIMLCINSGL
jgi:hypothetical protein